MAVACIAPAVATFLLVEARAGARDMSSTSAGQYNAEGGVYRFEDTATHVRVTGAAPLSGEEDQLAVTLKIDAGFHINANPASLEYLIPTTLNVTELKPILVTYPEPVRFKPKFAEQPIDVYEGIILITAAFPKGALATVAALHGSVTAQACTDLICLPPSELPLLAR